MLCDITETRNKTTYCKARSSNCRTAIALHTNTTHRSLTCFPDHHNHSFPLQPSSWPTSPDINPLHHSFGSQIAGLLGHSSLFFPSHKLRSTRLQPASRPHFPDRTEANSTSRLPLLPSTNTHSTLCFPTQKQNAHQSTTIFLSKATMRRLLRIGRSSAGPRAPRTNSPRAARHSATLVQILP